MKFERYLPEIYDDRWDWNIDSLSEEILYAYVGPEHASRFVIRQEYIGSDEPLTELYADEPGLVITLNRPEQVIIVHDDFNYHARVRLVDPDGPKQVQGAIQQVIDAAAKRRTQYEAWCAEMRKVSGIDPTSLVEDKKLSEPKSLGRRILSLFKKVTGGES